ncbi:hypothetical protein NFA_15950 [Nocardia farcinica IFM 10152]|uniref:Uncharacterized protein n=2 Tax=Nocardia farcinica TaxID=37329 RepID=Q5YZF0_NOCFA|nr:hypothetical protein NFA_15950 [Nocardia farcinica IFM 10152]
MVSPAASPPMIATPPMSRKDGGTHGEVPAPHRITGYHPRSDSPCPEPGMSSTTMILAAALDTLAQIGNPTPEAPPVSDKILQLVRYLTWFVLLAGICAIIYAGGRFAWEKWTGGGLESPKMVAGAMIGGAVATSAGTIMNAVIG